MTEKSVLANNRMFLSIYFVWHISLGITDSGKPSTAQLRLNYLKGKHAHLHYKNSIE